MFLSSESFDLICSVLADSIVNYLQQRMGSSTEKVETSHIPEGSLQYPDPPLPHRYHPPFRRFGKVQEKKKGRFISYSLSVTDPFVENMSVSFEVFDKLYDAFTVKTEKIFVENAIKQENITDRWLYQIDTEGLKQTIFVRPYTDTASHSFASLLCQLYFLDKIQKLPCANLHQKMDNYTVETGITLLAEPNSHIIVMERVDATLSQIIAFKRGHHWNWTVPQFYRLTHDLVSALHTLHEAQITHNDIRPSTVYYSLTRRCWILGSYSSCMNEAGAIGVILRQTIRRSFSKIQAQVNRKQFDVHSLGMTLMSAFYLCEIIDYEVAAKKNTELIDRYQILKLINAMLAPPEKRANVQQLKKKLHSMSYDEDFMQEMISSMKHRERPSPVEAIEQRVAVSNAYQHLGLWNQWKKQFQESHHLMEKQHHGIDEADGLVHLALIDHCRGDFRSSDTFAKEAAQKYRQYGKRQLEESSLGAAQSYYKKAVTCAKFYELDPDPDLALSLSGLSDVHRDKGGYYYSKTLAKAASDVVAKAEGKNTIQYGFQMLKEAKLQVETDNFQGAEKMIEHCLNLADRVKEINQDGSIALKGESLVVKAKNYDRWAQSLPQFEQHFILDKGKTAAREAVQTYHMIDQDHHLELADVVKTVGLINIKRRNYHESIRQYSRALDILQSYESDHNDVELKERGQLLCLRGDAHSFIGEYENSIRDYLDALRIFKERFGSHHNKVSALAFGSLAKIYSKIHMEDEAATCFNTGMQILSDVTSKNDPKYLQFQKLRTSLIRH